MKTIKITRRFCLAGFLLCAFIHSVLAYSEAHENNSSIEAQTTALAAKSDFIDRNLSNKRIVKKIRGSTDSGDIILSKDKSLSCSLASWELIGVFDNNRLVTTEGQFVFKITNHDSENHDFVLFELLILDKEGNVLTTSNPFRDLQGEIIEIEPPIEKEESRILTRGWKYQQGWHNITLKSCQWANSYEDYIVKYPELKNYQAP